MKKGSYEDGVVYHAGFPNAGEDDHTPTMSLDALLVKRRLSTYFWRLESAIPELRWGAKSILIVDRSLSPKTNKYCVVVEDEGFIVARFTADGFVRVDGTKIGEHAELWGVITYVVQPA